MYICGTSPNHAAISPARGAVGPCMSALKRGVSWQPWGIPPSRVGCRPKRTFMRTHGGVGKPGSRIRHPTLEEGKNGVHGKWAVVQTYPCLSRKYTCHSYHPPSPAYTREMEGGGSNLAVSCTRAISPEAALPKSSLHGKSTAPLPLIYELKRNLTGVMREFRSSHLLPTAVKSNQKIARCTERRKQ